MPDRLDAEPLGSHDLPLKVVTDHPGFARANSEHSHRVPTGPLLGLAEAVFGLDLYVIESVFEGEPLDLGALRLRRAVGDQRQLDAQLLQPVERLVRVGEHR